MEVRDGGRIVTKRARLEQTEEGFREWNLLSEEVRNIKTLTRFKRGVKKCILEQRGAAETPKGNPQGPDPVLGPDVSQEPGYDNMDASEESRTNVEDMLEDPGLDGVDAQELMDESDVPDVSRLNAIDTPDGMVQCRNSLIIGRSRS